MIELIIFIYIITILIGYFGIRSELIKEKWEPDPILFIVVFIPVVNVIWGILSFFDSEPRKFRKFLKWFFRLK